MNGNDQPRVTLGSPGSSATGSDRLASAHLGAIISIAADAIISIDVLQRITLFNTGAEKIFGYTAEEAMHQPLEMLLPEYARDVHRKHIRNFAESPISARRMGERATISGRRKNGEIFPAEASISKIDVEGEQVFTVILRDATERMRTEQGLQFLAEAGKKLNRSLDLGETLEGLVQMVVPVLADCCIVDIFHVDGRLARTAVAALHPEHGQLLRDGRERLAQQWRVLPALQSAFARNEPLIVHEMSDEWLTAQEVSEEYRTQTRAVGVRSMLVFALSLRARAPGVMTFLMTNSGRVLDDSYIALARELAARVAQAIENGELYRLSLQAVAARDEVVAIVSHDLRNPISVVMMCASTLSQEPLPEAATIVDLARTVHQSAEWMNSIIQDLLDVAHLESGRFVVRRESEALAPLIANTIERHRPLADERELRLSAEVEADIPEVSIDAARVSQVFANLIGNALKFTEPGGAISVGARMVDGRVVVSVADTGRGIDAEHLPRLFDRFWQARRDDGERGTGLGLAIARGIVEAHRGVIWVESAVGIGTTFFFTLPMAGSGMADA